MWTLLGHQEGSVWGAGGVALGVWKPPPGDRPCPPIPGQFGGWCIRPPESRPAPPNPPLALAHMSRSIPLPNPKPCRMDSTPPHQPDTPAPRSGSSIHTANGPVLPTPPRHRASVTTVYGTTSAGPTAANERRHRLCGCKKKPHLRGAETVGNEPVPPPPPAPAPLHWTHPDQSCAPPPEGWGRPNGPLTPPPLLSLGAQAALRLASAWKPSR